MIQPKIKATISNEVKIKISKVFFLGFCLGYFFPLDLPSLCGNYLDGKSIVPTRG
jgi:hypothetical protein